ncbi:MAG: hypothetical protein SFW66_08690 [Gammaproteobacteria bacterium]|nr:hypothetical protein [Gammaproteobacteria bacterium]
MTKATTRKENSTTYTRVTPRSLNRFTLFNSHDKTNGTKITRSPSDYADLLGLKLSLKEYLIQLANEKGQKIRILDAGCGSGKTIDLLLSDKELENYIERIDGISLHYFNNIESVMQKHTSRFYYYSGTAQNVLAKAVETFGAYDFIMDVWGAYPYSEDKLNLLKQYHQALKPQGIARIYSTKDSDLKIKIGTPNKVNRCFPQWSTETYPETFTHEKSNSSPNISTIVMKKTSMRWPLDRCDILSSKKMSVIYATHLSTAQLQKRNALKYSNVVVQPKPNQGVSLRPLSLKK